MRQSRTVELAQVPGRFSPLLLQSLVPAGPGPLARRRGATFFVSVCLHSALMSAVVVLPLLLSRSLPSARAGQTIFLPPLEIATLPPPPAPLGGPSGRVRVARRIDPDQRGLFAPVAIPTQITQEEAFSFDFGERDGIKGGVPRDSVGPIPPLPPLPPQLETEHRSARVVRISRFAQPKLLRKVAPVYPELAIAAHVAATVTLEAEVDTRGHVTSVSVLRGHPLFDEAAIEAVKQWRYQPLLLNGEPTGFILTVTIDFHLQQR
jgi:protein TonB